MTTVDNSENYEKTIESYYETLKKNQAALRRDIRRYEHFETQLSKFKKMPFNESVAAIPDLHNIKLDFIIDALCKNIEKDRVCFENLFFFMTKFDVEKLDQPKDGDNYDVFNECFMIFMQYFQATSEILKLLEDLNLVKQDDEENDFDEDMQAEKLVEEFFACLEDDKFYVDFYKEHANETINGDLYESESEYENSEIGSKDIGDTPIAKNISTSIQSSDTKTPVNNTQIIKNQGAPVPRGKTLPFYKNMKNTNENGNKNNDGDNISEGDEHEDSVLDQNLEKETKNGKTLNISKKNIDKTNNKKRRLETTPINNHPINEHGLVVIKKNIFKNELDEELSGKEEDAEDESV